MRRSAKRAADVPPTRPHPTTGARAKPATAARSASTPRTRPAAKAAKAAKAKAPPPATAARRSSSTRGRASTSGNGAGAGRARPPAPAPLRKVPPAGYAAPTPVAGEDRPGVGDVVLTAVQAAGELTQIGLELARQTLRSILGRLPRP